MSSRNLRHITGIAASVATLALALSAAQAHEEKRQLGSHVHGVGALNIAIDGKTVVLELTVPGMDIVGFEHEAASDEEKTTVEKATKDLETEPLKLFVLPEAAGCKVTSSKVHLHDHDHDDEEKEGEAKHDDHAKHDHQGEEHHQEFHAEYALECADASKLTSIDFPFFARFTGSKELDVVILDGANQTKHEVKAQTPRLDR